MWSMSRMMWRLRRLIPMRLPKLYLYDGSFTDEEEAYYEALRSSEDVVALVEDVNARLEEAIASDEALRDFFARLSQESGETQE